MEKNGYCFDYIDIDGCFVFNGLKSFWLMVSSLQAVTFFGDFYRMNFCREKH